MDKTEPSILIPGCSLFYAITVHRRSMAYRERRYDIALVYSDPVGMQIIRRIAPIGGTAIFNKQDAIKLFRETCPDQPVQFVSVESPYIVNNKVERM